MSKDKKFEKPVSVKDLGTPEKDGFLTKQGGSIKTWKKRYFLLKGDTLYYFKTKNDTVQTGEIKLTRESVANEEPKKGGKFYFSITTARRCYLIHADSEDVMRQWVEAITRSLDTMKGGGGGSSGGSASRSGGGGSTDPKSGEVSLSSTPAETRSDPPAARQVESRPATSATRTGTPRELVSNAKEVIPFLQDEESKVLEFWQIWSESIPPSSELQAGLNIEYHVSTSANMQKLTWRTAGPQNIFIQKMVDFFWNVGAPESEIDRLNDVGALINPIKIGSWIDMSAKGGMDGGWYFPVDIPLKIAIEAADSGEPSRKVSEWADRFGVERAWSVGRDMGAAPPRQTETRVFLPGTNRARQVEIGLEAFSMFGFPPLPDYAISILNEGDNEDSAISMSIITSSEGFVRLGLMSPRPSPEVVQRLCAQVGANIDDLREFERALGSRGPSFVEYQFLKEGFGYGVYKEGFDLVFHFDVGQETV